MEAKLRFCEGDVSIVKALSVHQKLQFGLFLEGRCHFTHEGCLHQKGTGAGPFSPFDGEFSHYYLSPDARSLGIHLGLLFRGECLQYL